MKSITLKLIVSVVLCSLVFGQGTRMGTASSSQLLIPQGARYLSGGGAASNAVGLDAAFWNPAGIAISQNRVNAIASRRNYIADIDINFLGFSVDFGRLGSMALTARTFAVGEIPVTTIFYPDGTGQEFTPNFVVVGASYSKRVSNNTSVGVTANVVQESFGRVSANGLAFDIGVQHASLMNIDGLNVGVVIKNFGNPLRYEGAGLYVKAAADGSNRPQDYYVTDAAEFDLPFIMDIGLSYSVAGANLGMTFTSNYFATDETKFMASYNLMNMVEVRFGYLMSGEFGDLDDDASTDEIVESDFDLKNIYANYSMGASLNLQQFTGMNLSLDYAFIPTEYFGNNQVFAFRVGF